MDKICQEGTMPAYITLFNWTEQGIRDVKDTARRAQAAREAWEAAGGRFIGIWWTFGQFDGVLVHEAPDDAAASQLLMSTGMKGDVRTTTMRAFGEEEIDSVLAGLS
jgi:uncharacterized protein with GYD domain